MNPTRRLLWLPAVLFLAQLPASAAEVAVPEIGVQVVDQESGRALAGVGVALVAKTKIGGDFHTVSEAVTNPDGRVSFAAMGQTKLRAVGLRFTWDGPGRRAGGAPHRVRRGVHFQLKAKKGEKVGGERRLRPGGLDSYYLTRAGAEYLSNCLNLVAFEDRGRSLEVTFERPSTYARCQGTHFANPDAELVGRRDVNEGQGNFYSFDDDVSLGNEFARVLAPQQPLLDDPLVTGYVRDLVYRLGKASDMPNLKFQSHVIDADVLNAFAVPGGYLYVYRGLIEATSTEAELVGVLAHEVAHVTGRHSTEGLTSNIKKILAAELVAALLTEGEDADDAQVISNIISGGAYLWLAFGSRKHETEADRLGSQYALRAGYDPAGLMSFFETLSRERGKPQTRLEHYLSDHPNDERRIANVQEMIDYFLPASTGELVTSSPEYLAVKKRLAQLPPPAMDAEEAAGLLLTSFKSTNDRLLERALYEYQEKEEE